MKNFIYILIALLVNFIYSVAVANDGIDNKKGATAMTKQYLIIELKDGPVKIELYPQKAPGHVARLVELANEKFYDGIVFHRVIDGFMVQTGDPTGTGMGGSSKADLKAEFNDISHVRGVVSMARSSNPNSANSQFFIVTKDSQFLDGQYTAFGKVIEGMEFVDKIKKGDARSNGKVENPDKMISVRVSAE